MRLFIAVDLSDELKRYVNSLQQTFEAKGTNLARRFHLTLKFLGETPEEKIPEIKKALSTISFDPFTATLSPIGVFPDEKRIRVIWVGAQPEDKFNELSEKVNTVLENLFPKDTRFYPHITLGRVKFVPDKPALLEKLKQPVEPKEFPVNKIILFKSTLTDEGHVYEELWQSKPL